MSRFDHLGGCTKSALSEGASVAGTPRAGEYPALRTAGQGSASHHGLSPRAHLGRERPRGARPFRAADQRAFHRRTMRATREDAFPIHSPRRVSSPHPCPPQPGDCKLGPLRGRNPLLHPRTPGSPHPASLPSAALRIAKKRSGTSLPTSPPPSPRNRGAGGVHLGWRPQSYPAPPGRRFVGAAREPHVCDSPVRGERGCAPPPKQRQSGRLCPAAAAARRGTGAHLSAGTARRPRAARPGARPPRRRRHASRCRRSRGLREERHGHARGLSAERESALPRRAPASSPRAPRTHRPRPAPRPPLPAPARADPSPAGPLARPLRPAGTRRSCWPPARRGAQSFPDSGGCGGVTRSEPGRGGWGGGGRGGWAEKVAGNEERIC